MEVRGENGLMCGRVRWAAPRGDELHNLLRSDAIMLKPHGLIPRTAVNRSDVRLHLLDFSFFFMVGSICG